MWLAQKTVGQAEWAYGVRVAPVYIYWQAHTKDIKMAEEPAFGRRVCTEWAIALRSGAVWHRTLATVFQYARITALVGKALGDTVQGVP